MTDYPTEKVWNYFTKHHDNIRNCVAEFLPVPQWQSMVGPFGEETEHTLEEFDEAVKEKNTQKLSSIMSDAWGRAPESRMVYSIPGFSELCNLLDGTVDGWEDNNNPEEIEDEKGS